MIKCLERCKWGRAHSAQKWHTAALGLELPVWRWGRRRSNSFRNDCVNATSTTGLQRKVNPFEPASGWWGLVPGSNITVHHFFLCLRGFLFLFLFSCAWGGGWGGGWGGMEDVFPYKLGHKNGQIVRWKDFGSGSWGHKLPCAPPHVLNPPQVHQLDESRTKIKIKMMNRSMSEAPSQPILVKFDDCRLWSVKFKRGHVSIKV